MIPGSDLLQTALSVIAKQPWQWFPFSGRLTQPNGQYLSAYGTPVSVLGSAQAVPRNLYQEYGLDFNKYYLKFFVSQNVIDVNRDVSGDLFVFNGQTYQCLSITPWYGIDGWVEIMTVQIQNIPLVTGITAPANGNYTTSQNLTFTVNYNAPVVVTGTPVLPLSALAKTIGGNALYTGGSGTSALTFAYTVQNTDNAHGLASSPPMTGGTIVSATNALIPASTAYVAPDLSGITLNGG